MTDPIIQLETTQLSVEPGGQGRTLVTVRNLGNIVEGFALQVLGEGVSEWSEVTPAEVQVYPEQEATAVVVFSPPAGNTTRSGTLSLRGARRVGGRSRTSRRLPRAIWRSAGSSACRPRSPR